jgi:hypothetical protein
MQERPILTMAGFALVWALAAIVSDGTTFHLAPIIVAAVPAMSWTGRRSTGLLIGVGGAVAIAVLLALGGRLGGPSLLPFGGALLESVAGAFVGGLVGTVAASAMSHANSVHDPDEFPALG